MGSFRTGKTDEDNFFDIANTEPNWCLNDLAWIARDKGLTQEQLAERCQVSRVTINRYFRGHSELKASEFLKLLTAIGLSFEDKIKASLDQALRQDHHKSFAAYAQSPPRACSQPQLVSGSKTLYGLPAHSSSEEPR